MAERQGENFVMGGSDLSFASFILGLGSSALIHLGESPDPETGATLAPDLVSARQTIDVLDLLRVKTRGNLTDEEDRLFSDLLTDLRLRYVKKTRP